MQPRQRWRPTVAAVLAAVVATAVGVGGASGSATRTPSGCAPSKPKSITSSRDGADVSLVPDGAVQVQLCRYGGLNDSPPLGLQAGKVVTDTGTVGSLASEINGLPPGPAGPVLCPADDGSEIVAAFRYSSGPDDPVGVALTGCEEVGNGHITRTAATSPLIGRLESLVPVPAPRPAKRDATISGYVRLCGGPAPGRCWDGSIGTCTRGGGCVTTDRIAVLDGGGKVVARARLRHGRFRVSVPAGDYVVRLLADGRQVHGRIVQTRRVTVRAGHTATVRFQFDVP